MWPNRQFPANLVTFTEEIINGKFLFLCSDACICITWFNANSFIIVVRSSSKIQIPPKLLWGKGVLKICSTFTGEHPCRSAISLYWNHIPTWVFSCKFAAYFQNTFSWEHLRAGASEDLYIATIMFWTHNQVFLFSQLCRLWSLNQKNHLAT